MSKSERGERTEKKRKEGQKEKIEGENEAD